MKKATVGLALATLIWATEGAASDIECTPSTGDARFRLFRTENMWNLLKLDTQTGRIWQVQASVNGNRIKLPVNPERIVESGRNGRFTLCPTGNMWTFVLLDQETGQTWQVQFSMDEGESGIVGEISVPVAPPQ